MRIQTAILRSSASQRASAWPVLGLLLSAALGASACQQQAAALPEVRPTYDKTGALTKLEADADHDGKVDTWAYMDGARVVRVEVDENGDGKVDRWEFHQSPVASPQSPLDSARGRPVGDPDRSRRVASPQQTGPLERVERATKFDGKVSQWEFYENGSLVRAEEDADGDGKIDKWVTYNGGSVATMALDTAHRGKPDRRLIYRPDGTLDRIEIDPTGSGSFHTQSPPPAR